MLETFIDLVVNTLFYWLNMNELFGDLLGITSS